MRQGFEHDDSDAKIFTINPVNPAIR